MFKSLVHPVLANAVINNPPRNKHNNRFSTSSNRVSNVLFTNYKILGYFYQFTQVYKKKHIP